MDWRHLFELIGVVGGMGVFFWKILDKRFDKMDVELKEIKTDVQDIKERLSVIETENIIYNIVPEDKRSEAAKRMWARRRSKKLLKNLPN